MNVLHGDMSARVILVDDEYIAAKKAYGNIFYSVDEKDEA